MVNEWNAAVVFCRCCVDIKKPFPTEANCAIRSHMNFWLRLLTLAYHTPPLRRWLAAALLASGVVLGLALAGARSFAR